MKLNSNSNLVFSTAIMLSAALMPCFSSASLQAQIEQITFTRSGATMSDTVVFNFPTNGSVAFDQLGTGDAIDQNNDGIGQELFLVDDPAGSGPISSIGVVSLNDTLMAGDTFGGGSNMIDLGPAALSGDSIYVGFSEAGTTNVGYFQISFEPADQLIIYSNGFFGAEGTSLIVTDPNAVPEPSTLAGIGLVAMLTATRRRRRS